MVGRTWIPRLIRPECPLRITSTRNRGFTGSPFIGAGGCCMPMPNITWRTIRISTNNSKCSGYGRQPCLRNEQASWLDLNIRNSRHPPIPRRSSGLLLYSKGNIDAEPHSYGGCGGDGRGGSLFDGGSHSSGSWYPPNPLRPNPPFVNSYPD